MMLEHAKGVTTPPLAGPFSLLFLFLRIVTKWGREGGLFSPLSFSLFLNLRPYVQHHAFFFFFFFSVAFLQSEVGSGRRLSSSLFLPFPFFPFFPPRASRRTRRGQEPGGRIPPPRGLLFLFFFSFFFPFPPLSLRRPSGDEKVDQLEIDSAFPFFSFPFFLPSVSVGGVER